VATVVPVLYKKCRSCKKNFTLDEFYVFRSYRVNDCKACYMKNNLKRESTGVNIIDLIDTVCSQHGVDLLQIVKENNKKRGILCKK